MYRSSVNLSLSLFVFLVLFVFVSCDKDPQTSLGPEFTIVTGDVVKVSPKQALITCSVTIPSGIEFADCQAGITYTFSPQINPSCTPLIPMDDLSSGNQTQTIKIRHLKCGTTYYYASYVKYNGIVYLGDTKQFRTEDLPEHAVDLDLPDDNLWADSNLGAASSFSPGAYYQWGGTEPRETHEVYSLSKYKFYSEDYDEEGNRVINLSKYTRDDDFYLYEKDTFGLHCSWYDYTNDHKFIGDDKQILEREDDIVSLTMGGNWRTPRISDFLSLINFTSRKSYTKSGTRYQVLEASNGNTLIFWPGEDMVPLVETGFALWTSNLWYDGEPTVPEQNKCIMPIAYIGSRGAVAFIIIPDGFKLNINDKNEQPKYMVLQQAMRYSYMNVRGVYSCEIE